MLTYENVIDIFSDYLEDDTLAEVVPTRYCYALMMWDPAAHNWDDVVPCESPEDLFDELLEQANRFRSYQLAEEQGIEDYTPEIEAKVEEMCRVYQEKRRELES